MGKCNGRLRGLTSINEDNTTDVGGEVEEAGLQKVRVERDGGLEAACESNLI